MARSRINFKSIDMKKEYSLYELSAEQITKFFRPAEYYALLKLEPNTSDLCTVVLKLHLQFLKLEAYEYCCVGRDWMESHCY